MCVVGFLCCVRVLVVGVLHAVVLCVQEGGVHIVLSYMLQPCTLSHVHPLDVHPSTPYIDYT